LIHTYTYTWTQVFDDELFVFLSESIRWRKKKLSEYTVQAIGVLLYAFSRVEVNDQLVSHVYTKNNKMYVCVIMSTSIYVYIYIHIHICVHLYIYIYTYIHIHIHTCAYIQMYVMSARIFGHIRHCRRCTEGISRAEDQAKGQGRLVDHARMRIEYIDLILKYLSVMTLHACMRIQTRKYIHTQLLDYLAEIIQELPVSSFTPQAVSVIVSVYAGPSSARSPIYLLMHMFKHSCIYMYIYISCTYTHTHYISTGAHRRKSPSVLSKDVRVADLPLATGILNYMSFVAKSIPPHR
jgi:hypothetical protein